MEIFQNTILKIIVRQGTDLERKNIVLTSGELGYTTDTKRLYIGDGASNGGNVIGNLYKGAVASITSPFAITPQFGDIGYGTDQSKLYVLESGTGSNLSDWRVIGGVYTSNDNRINISADNKITLNALSANSVSSDFVTGPIIVSSGRIGLSSNIPFQTVSTKTITVSSGLLASIEGTDITNTAVNPLSSNLLIRSNQLFANYDGAGTTLLYSRGIAATRLSAGHYKFTFGPLPTSNIIPMTQILGSNIKGFEPRVISTTLSSCDVKIVNIIPDYIFTALSSISVPPDIDANVILTINY